MGEGRTGGLFPPGEVLVVGQLVVGGRALTAVRLVRRDVPNHYRPARNRRPGQLEVLRLGNFLHRAKQYGNNL